MPFPIKVCAICGEKFELKPNKPGFANRCPECSANDEESSAETNQQMTADERDAKRAMDAERRKAIRDLLYRKDS